MGMMNREESKLLYKVDKVVVSKYSEKGKVVLMMMMGCRWWMRAGRGGQREFKIVVMVKMEDGDRGRMVDREGMARWCTRWTRWW